MLSTVMARTLSPLCDCAATMVAARTRLVAGVVVLGAATLAAHAGSLRIGVLTAPGLPVKGLEDLITVTLSGERGVALVERDQIDAVLRELELATALGADGTGVRLKLGALLHADLLVLLNLETDGDSKYVRVVICDTALGARLTQDRFLADGKTEVLAAAVCDQVRATRTKLDTGIERIVAVPPFVSHSLTHELDHLQRQLPHVLEAAFSTLPQTAVLEVDEVRAIRRELDLRGGPLQSRVLAWFVSGEYRQAGSLGQPDAKLNLSLALSDGQATQSKVERTFATVDELGSYLRSNALSDLIDTVQKAAPLSVEQQVASMEERARSFDRLGQYDLAQDIREASLLLAPNDAGAHIRLINAYTARVGTWPHPGWYDQPSDKVRAAWTARPTQWRRALELLEHLIRHDLISQYEALTLLRTLDGALHTFMVCGPQDPPQGFSVHDPELLALYDRGLAACTQAERRFRTDTYPHIRALPIGEPDEEQRWRGRWADPRAEWYQGLFVHPDYRRRPAGPPQLDTTAEQLARYADVIAQVRSSEYGLCSAILGALERCAVPPPGRMPIPEAATARFLEALEATQDPLDAAYARLGRLLLQRAGVQTQPRPDDAPVADEALSLEQEFRRITGDAPQALLRLRRELAGQTAPEAPMSPERREALPPVMRVDGTTDSNFDLQFERVEFRVRMPDGSEMPFGELSWADQPGFVSEWCSPWGFERVGDQLDVVWSQCYVLMHRKPGLLEPLLLDHDADVRCVRADATHVWVACGARGLQVYDWAGHLLQTIDTKEGLPPHDRALSFALYRPGQVVAAGSFGEEGRGWCARVDVNTNPATVDLLLESTEVVGSRSEERDVPRAERDARAIKRTFVPWRLDTFCEPTAAGRRVIYIDRRTSDDQELRPLLVDPERRTVRMIENLAETDMTSDLRPSFLPDGRPLLPIEERILLQRPLGHPRVYDAPQQVVYEDLRANHRSLQWGNDGYLYAPTLHYWARIDPETLTAEPLGARPAFAPQAGDGTYVASSAHFGLVCYTSAGKFFRVHVTSHLPTPPEALAHVQALHIMDADTQAPLAQAAVAFDNHGQIETVPADETGSAAVPAAMTSSVATITAEGYEVRYVVLRAGRHQGAVDGALTVTLRPLLRLAGQVLDADNRPAAGVRVSAKPGALPEMIQPALAETVTDDQGMWSITVLPDEKNGLWLTFACSTTHAAERELEVTPAELALLQSGQHATHVRAAPAHATSSPNAPPSAATPSLPTYGGQEIIVCDPTGQPLSDAEVSWAARRPTDGDKLDKLRTDSSGLCTLPPLVRGMLAVRAPGYAPHVDAPQVPGPSRRTIRLAAIEPVKLRVLDPNDAPLPGVTVAAYAKGVRLLFSQDGTSGADGTLTWDSLPTGAVAWAATQAGRELTVVDAGPGAAGEWVVHVRPVVVTHVFGAVTDAATGAPVAEFQATLSRAPAPGQPRVRRPRTGPAAQAADRAMQGLFAAGRFDLYAEEATGAYDLEVSATGYAPQRLVVNMGEAVELQQDVQLRPSTGVRVQVLLADGRPAGEIDVLATKHALRAVEVPLRSQWFDDELQQTDAQGIAKLKPELGQRWFLTANDTAMAMGVADENSQELQLTLGPWARVEGRWERSGDDLPVQLSLTPIWPKNEHGYTSRTLKETVAADGTFAFEHLLPGDYWLCREVPLQESSHGGSATYLRQTRVTLALGEQLQVDSKAVGRPVTGQLVRADGTPVVDGHFIASLGCYPPPARPDWRQLTQQERDAWGRLHPSGFQLRFDRQGAFLACEVPPGTYRLNIHGSAPGVPRLGGVDPQRDLTIPPVGEDESRTFDLGTFNVDEPPTAAPARVGGMWPKRVEGDDEFDWMSIGLRIGAAALVLTAILLAAHRRWHRRPLPHDSALPVLVFVLLAVARAPAGTPDDSAAPDTAALRPVAEAVDTYQQACGLWPQRLEDLVPRYANAVPPACTYEWSWTGYVHVACPVGSQQLVFVFNGDDRGWYAGRPGSFRVVSAPPPRPRAVSAPRLELLKAAHDEFQHRIEREPNNPDHRRAMIAYFYAADALADAQQAALDWVAADSTAVMPRYALADIARKQRTGLDGRWHRTEAQERIHDAWAARARDSYAMWRVFVQPASDTLAQDQLHRVTAGALARDKTEWLYAEVFLNEDADLLTSADRVDQLLALCERWEAAGQRFTDPPPDQGYHLFRTVAYLRQQDYDKATAAYAQALAASEAGHLWIDPHVLEDAVQRRAALPDYPDLVDFSEGDWRLKLNCPPPER